MRHNVIAFGVDSYDNYRPLRFCARDAESFAEAMQLVTGATCNVFTAKKGERLDLQDAQSSIESVATEGYGPGDTLTVYLAGHGVTFQGADYFVCSNSRRNEPDSSLRIDTIISCLRESGAGLAILIIDACRVPDENRTAGMFGEGAREAAKKLGIVSIFGCAPDQTCQESEALGGGHGIFTYALVELLRETRELVPFRANQRLKNTVSQLTAQLKLREQEPIIEVSTRSFTLDLLSRREIQVVEQPKRMLILAGPPNAGKTTLASQVAQEIGFQHIEMGNFASRAYHAALRDGSFSDGGIHSFISNVYWADGQYDRVAREALASNPNATQVVVSGPRRTEEIEVLQDSGFTTELIYVYADSHSRWVRHCLNAAQYGNDDMLSIFGFVRRDMRENAWGLPRIGLMPDCTIVENKDRQAALDGIQAKLSRRHWLTNTA